MPWPQTVRRERLEEVPWLERYPVFVDRRLGGGKSLLAWARIRPRLLERSPTPFAYPPALTQTTLSVNGMRSGALSGFRCCGELMRLAAADFLPPDAARATSTEGQPRYTDVTLCEYTRGSAPPPEPNAGDRGARAGRRGARRLQRVSAGGFRGPRTNGHPLGQRGRAHAVGARLQLRPFPPRLQHGLVVEVFGRERQPDLFESQLHDARLEHLLSVGIDHVAQRDHPGPVRDAARRLAGQRHSHHVCPLGPDFAALHHRHHRWIQLDPAQDGRGFDEVAGRQAADRDDQVARKLRVARLSFGECGW